ncbi:F-box-like domain superfamily [Arabidopsis suecica]|uniref:F-box-like domain superfamily n=1 Tax=Arabidopsis suecica TaxID=45249 RepID=A0A8T2BHC5_ARASU|nr:F-box-like domain superfamily [Arabidopsis suecica]
MVADLPHDLEWEILSRVPATSLKELQTTCKRWYALFRDPRFVKNNLSKAATHVIFDNRSGYSVTEINTLIHSINLCGIQNSFDPLLGVQGKLNRLKDSEQDKISDIISHCDGLLLCDTYECGRLVVWNPCTGQTRLIQANILVISNRYVLGYVNNKKSCNSYKILTFNSLQCLVDSSRAKFEIYEFNSDSWRILDDIHPDCCPISKGVTLKGNAYWFASDNKSKFILKFDFTRERLGRLCIPFQKNYDDQIVVLSVVREEKLALLQQWFDTDSSKMNIWVTKTKIDDDDKDLSWCNFLVVDFGKVIVTSDALSYMSFFIDEEDKMVVCSDTRIGTKTRTSIYFAKEGLQVHQEIAQKPNKCWPFLVSYVPSLVQIQ